MRCAARARAEVAARPRAAIATILGCGDGCGASRVRVPRCCKWAMGVADGWRGVVGVLLLVGMASASGPCRQAGRQVGCLGLPCLDWAVCVCVCVSLG